DLLELESRVWEEESTRARIVTRLSADTSIRSEDRCLYDPPKNRQLRIRRREDVLNNGGWLVCGLFDYVPVFPDESDPARTVRKTMTDTSSVEHPYDRVPAVIGLDSRGYSP